MRIYVNRKTARGPWGGENSFMGALCRWLSGRGHSIVIDRDAAVDIALLNSLTLLNLDAVQSLARRGVPVVHRKTGFICSGPQELRAVVDGVVEGDRRQIAFSPHVACSIFQSEYSRRLFEEEGFSGPAVVIHNGVDETRFHTCQSVFAGLGRRTRRYWQPGEKLRFLTVSWSRDPSKGFADLCTIDAEIEGRSDLEYTFVGRTPDDVHWRNIQCNPPQSHRRLARTYRSNDVLVFLGRNETCSNTILEGINCGLPVVYHPSGASPETAGPYGLAFEGSLAALMATIRAQHGAWREAAADNPYRMARVGPSYLEVLESVLDGELPERRSAVAGETRRGA